MQYKKSQETLNRLKLPVHQVEGLRKPNREEGVQGLFKPENWLCSVGRGGVAKERESLRIV